jgi:hypothetical protein
MEALPSASELATRDGSFETRMQERRRQRERRTTELFEPPGFEDLFRVEMQTVSYKKLADIALRHQRQRDEALQALYIAADQVLTATVGFRKVGPDGELQELDEPLTWGDLARAFDPTIDATVRPRAALIRLLEGAGVVELNGDWYTWNTRGNAQVDRELQEDFPETP